MHTHARTRTLILALACGLGASLALTAAAQEPAAPAPSAPAPPAPAPPAPAPSGPQFTASEEIPDFGIYNDAYGTTEIKLGGEPLAEDLQLERWLAEANAGRARAGVLAGSYLAYRALTPADCDAARAPLLKAETLGSDQSAWMLAQLAENQACGAVNRPDLEKWLVKAVAQDYLIAAQKLIDFHAPGADPAQQPGNPFKRYVYARVGAGYWQAVQTGGAANPPPPELAPEAVQAMEQALSATDRERAEKEAAAILAPMLKRHDRFGPVKPQEFARGSTGGGGEFVALAADYHRECQWNLRANCKGAQRLALVDVTSKGADFLDCRIELAVRDFVGGAALKPLERRVLLGPRATRRLLLGDVGEVPDRKALKVTCNPVRDLAANALAGKCRARLNGTVDAQRFYPAAARNRGIEGSAVVRYYVPPGSEEASDAEIVTSSGDGSLDQAAIATVRSGKYTRDCDYGLGNIRIAFKLEN
jgi:TonB family protein